jgi:transcriptional regulator with XRE-family HTH domain
VTSALPCYPAVATVRKSWNNRSCCRVPKVISHDSATLDDCAWIRCSGSAMTDPINLTNEELGERIRDRRRSLGLTQEALADRAHVSTETVGRLEQAAGNGPSLDTVYKVAKALGTTGSALLAADHSSDEVTRLVQGLPEREREIACVMLRALSVHTSAQQP